MADIERDNQKMGGGEEREREKESQRARARARERGSAMINSYRQVWSLNCFTGKMLVIGGTRS